MSKKKRKNRPRKYNKNFRLLSYNITEEPVEDKYTKQIPKKIIDQIQDFQEKIDLKPKEMIPQLVGYTKKYPNAPLFYNYLSAAYAKAGDIKSCESTILESIRKHPDYLFSKLNYALYSRPSVPKPPFEKQIDYLIAAIGLLDQLHADQFFSRLLKRRRGTQTVFVKKLPTVDLGIMFLHQSHQ